MLCNSSLWPARPCQVVGKSPGPNSVEPPKHLDYAQYPFSSPGSRLGLTFSPTFFGWNAAKVHCDHFAKEVASPFLRLEGMPAGRKRCWPSRCVIRRGGVEASFAFAEQDGMAIGISTDHLLRAHVGAKQMHQAEDAWTVLHQKDGWVLSLCAPGLRASEAHSGITFPIPPGHSRLGCGLADTPRKAMQLSRRAAALSEKQARQRADSEWGRLFSCVPEIEDGRPCIRDKYAECWWTLYNNLVLPRGRISGPAVYPDRVWHNAVWLWDACFHALALREADPSLARRQIQVLLDNQQPDGMIPDVIFDSGLYTDHTKPPLLAWAVWSIHCVDPNTNFLREVYPSLCALDDWWFRARDPNRNGLPGYEHPFSAGLDDSPRFDALDTSAPTAELEGVDLAAYLYAEREILSQIAATIGRSAEARDWKEKAAGLAALARGAFPRQDGFLYDLLEGKPVPVHTLFSLFGAHFLPLREGRRLLRRWLVQNPRFEDRFLLSTVAQDEPSYLPVRWRGAAWLNANYMVAELASRLGMQDEADHIAEKSVEMVAASPGVWEHYDVTSGRPGGPPTFGWTAAVFIEFALKRHRRATHAPRSA